MLIPAARRQGSYEGFEVDAAGAKCVTHLNRPYHNWSSLRASSRRSPKLPDPQTPVAFVYVCLLAAACNTGAAVPQSIASVTGSLAQAARTVPKHDQRIPNCCSSEQLHSSPPRLYRLSLVCETREMHIDRLNIVITVTAVAWYLANQMLFRLSHVTAGLPHEGSSRYCAKSTTVSS